MLHSLVRRVGVAALCLGLCACARQAAPSTPLAAAGRATPTPRFASPYAYEWFVRAELLRGRGQLPAAIEAYRAALASADEDPHVLARLATALAESGEQASAERALDTALAIEPASEEAWLARASFAESRGDAAAAYEAYERAEQADPLSPRAPLALAQLLDRQGSAERASSVRLRYQSRSLQGTRAAQAAQLTAAVQSGDPARVFAATLPYRLKAPVSGAPLGAAAKVLFARGQATRALRVLELLPEHARETELSLELLLACGRFAALDALLAERGPSVRDQGLVARAYLAVGRPELAQQVLELERIAHPDDVQLQLLAAQAALALGRTAEAAGAFAAILAGSGSEAAARSGLVRALQAEGLTALASELTQPHSAAHDAQ